MQSIILAVIIVATIFSSTYGAPKVTTKNGYTLNMYHDDSNVPASTVTGFSNTFFNVYPKECNYFNPNCCKNTHMYISPTYKSAPAAAWNHNCTIVVNGEYAKNNPNDLDMITHEAMHLTQTYVSGTPSWFIEGYADYARDMFGVQNSAVGWKLPKYEPTYDWTKSYRETAAFLKWMDSKYSGSTKRVEQKARNVSPFSTNFFKDETTKTLSQLWAQYVEDSKSTITFYSETGFEGESMEWKGLGKECENFLAYEFNDMVSSVDSHGACIILYSDWNCSGDETMLAPDCDESDCPCQWHSDLGDGCDFLQSASSHRLCDYP